MNSKCCLLPCLLAIALAARAEDPSLNFSGSVMPPIQWHVDPAYWDKFITEKRDSPTIVLGRHDFSGKHNSAGIVLGRSDFVVGGGLIYALTPEKWSDDRSLGQNILHLPIIKGFVPLPMPRPPGGTGKYFQWKEPGSDAWAVAANRPKIDKGPY